MTTHNTHLIIGEVILARVVSNNDTFQARQIVWVAGAMVNGLFVMPVAHGSLICQHSVALSI